jgi:peptidyl-tRNA hydrolase, PTH1 family
MLVDALAQITGVELNRLQHNAAVARVILNKKKVVLVKPLTFMNNSGESVGKLSRFYKVTNHQVLRSVWHASFRPLENGDHGVC